MYKFRALFAFPGEDDATFDTAERGEGGLILEILGENFSHAQAVSADFLNSHRGHFTAIEFVRWNPIVTWVPDN